MHKISCFILAACIVITSAAAKYTGPTNSAGFELIKEFEGFKPNFYRDNGYKIRTIGYGHACHVWNCKVPLNGKYSVPLTRHSAEQLLKEDLRARGRYEGCVNNVVTYSSLNENQFSALVSFVFNLGCGTLLDSTLLQKLNRGDIRGAANEFQRFKKSAGRVLNGLVRRRAAERNLFCSGNVC